MKMPSSAAERRRQRRIVVGFEGKRILVVGDLMLDQYIRGGVSRISPEAPVPVVTVSQESFLPGGAGNVAHNLSSLGADVDVIAVVGNDEAGRRLASDLKARRIAAEGLIVDRERVTSQKCRVIAERQQAVRYDRETSGPISHETEGRILALLKPALERSQAVILSDYGKGVVTPRVLKTVISGAKRLGIPVTVDPKVEHFKSYRGVTCITPNLQEAWAGMRRVPKPGEDSLDELGRDILRTLRCESLIVTRGPEGMSLFNSRGHAVHIPTQAREVFDVTGAGDTVIAVLTLALASGASIRQAAEIANHAAGIVVAKLGTAVTDVPELSRSLL